MNKKTLAFVAAALMALSFSSACSKKKDAPTTPAATETKPAEGGDATGTAPAPENPCGGGEANPCGSK